MDTLSIMITIAAIATVIGLLSWALMNTRAIPRRTVRRYIAAHGGRGRMAP